MSTRTLILLVLCFGLVSSASISPSFPHNAINSTIVSLRKLECDVDISFQQEGANVNIECKLEDVMAWLDTWFKPLLIVLVIFIILIATSLVLCCIRMSNLNLDCCGLSKRVGCRETVRPAENSNMIPLVKNPKDSL